MQSVGLVLAAIAMVLCIGRACAQSSIGEMAEIIGTATGSLGTRTAPLKNSDSVVEQQTIATGAASTARIAFHDLSTLSLAPTSSVKLDRFVYDPHSTVASAALRVGRGAFRFITGRSKAENISVRTPSAVIGLRGTIIDIEVRSGREIVWLRQGATQVCKGRQCVVLDRAGQGVFITAAGVSAPSTAPRAVFDFDAITGNRFPLFPPR